MATAFDEIIDLALLSVQDYKLNNIYNSSREDFEKITEGFLVRAVPNFIDCQSNLSYDLTNKIFLSDLSEIEKSILADIWVYVWFENKVNNITQIENTMTPNDFQRHSEAENLKQKNEYLDKMREKYSQKINKYLMSMPSDKWTNWGW